MEFDELRGRGCERRRGEKGENGRNVLEPLSRPVYVGAGPRHKDRRLDTGKLEAG